MQRQCDEHRAHARYGLCERAGMTSPLCVYVTRPASGESCVTGVIHVREAAPLSLVSAAAAVPVGPVDFSAGLGLRVRACATVKRRRRKGRRPLRLSGRNPQDAYTKIMAGTRQSLLLTDEQREELGGQFETLSKGFVELSSLRDALATVGFKLPQWKVPSDDRGHGEAPRRPGRSRAACPSPSSSRSTPSCVARRFRRVSRPCCPKRTMYRH
ncbi:hypothetical protein MTO96_051227 [Rhipicephalus appendiculatus]